MAEREFLEASALARRQHLPLEAVAQKAGFAQVAGEDQQPAVGLDEVVRELGMDVQRLVGWNRPRRRGPDDDPAYAGRQLRQPEGFRDLVRLCEAKSHVDRK